MATTREDELTQEARIEEHNERGSTPFTFEETVERYKKPALYILTAITVVVVGYLAYNFFILEPQIEEASRKIVRSQFYYEMDSIGLALNGDGSEDGIGFLALADDYGSTPSGNLAHLYVGTIYMRQGKYQDAIDYLEDFSTKSHIIGPRAVGLTGDAYVQLGNIDKAASLFKKAANKSKNPLTTPEYLRKGALAYAEIDEPGEALDMWQRIKEEYPLSAEGQEADKYIAYLEQLVSQE